MQLIDLFIIACAAWYISYALTKTDGPGGVFAWLREHIWHGRHGTDPLLQMPAHNGLLDCQICLIIWIALILLFAPVGIVTYALAAAGLGLMLHGFSGWRINL